MRLDPDLRNPRIQCVRRSPCGHRRGADAKDLALIDQVGERGQPGALHEDSVLRKEENEALRSDLAPPEALIRKPNLPPFSFDQNAGNGPEEVVIDTRPYSLNENAHKSNITSGGLPCQLESLPKVAK